MPPCPAHTLEGKAQRRRGPYAFEALEDVIRPSASIRINLAISDRTKLGEYHEHGANDLRTDSRVIDALVAQQPQGPEASAHQHPENSPDMGQSVLSGRRCGQRLAGVGSRSPIAGARPATDIRRFSGSSALNFTVREPV
jgi:hypothetical protein